MSHARDEGDGASRQRDEFGNWIGQPSTTAMYGGPSTDGATTIGLSTGDANAFVSNYYGGQPQENRHQGTARPEGDLTQRRGTTTGEYGRDGVGFMDRAKEKLEGIGGFKEDPGHVSTVVSQWKQVNDEAIRMHWG